MKIVLLMLIVLILVAVCVFFAYMAVRSGRGGNKQVVRPDRSKPWEAKLEDRNTTTEAWLVKGKYREFFGAVDRLGEGYADRLIDLEIAAEDRARERNTARNVLGQ